MFHSVSPALTTYILEFKFVELSVVVGIVKTVPTVITSEDKLLYFIKSSTVVLNLLAMLHKVSPTFTVYVFFVSSGKISSPISKVSRTSNAEEAVKNCYYVDVGYPGNSFVTNFSISSDVYWPIFKKYSGTIPNYNYDIDYNGNLITTQVDPITIDEKFNSHSIKLENWWGFVTSYPISATLTIKGLMKPILLIENIYIHAQFYGKKDIADGIYTIVGQHDSISGNGYTTTLSLLKVSN